MGRLLKALLVASIVSSICCVRTFAAGNSLTWHHSSGRVDADISTWNLRQVLERVAANTGWHVYLDPEAARNVSVKFNGLATGEALHALLGGLNFVVIPQTNEPSRLYVFRTTRDQATRLIVAKREPAKPIPKQLVVTLKPGSKTKIEDLARSLHAKILSRMDAQNAYLLGFDDDDSTLAASQFLASDPDVASVGSNFPIDPPPTLASSDASNPDLQLKPKSNDGPCQLVIGVIDTPVQSLPGNLNAFLEPAIHDAGDVAPTDQLTHGTAMTETILDSLQTTMQKQTAASSGGTVNTSVKILPVDVYGNSESTSTFLVAKGIVDAVNGGANILNLSLGGTGDSDMLHQTIINATQQGVVIYAAAGNDPVTTPTYPAAYPEVVSVTATDSSGQIAPYANRGSFIDMTAPGDNIVPFNGQQYQVEGTSTSTAFVSGAAAGLADANNACADQAESLLQKSVPKSSILKQAQ